jgi:serine-type D-Ala-D-Ala carboxypeptidase (penicillin-binding protein 5/6)
MLLAVRVLAAAAVLTAVGTGAVAHADDASLAPAPTVDAKAWLVVDLSNGAILAAKDPHRRLRPASTLKTLTAVTLLPRLDKSAEYRVQWEDAAVEGSAVGIVPGATYTVDDLFYGLFLPSGNDAAHALANAAGGVHHTVQLMQAEAQRLGAADTTVRNPSGLDAPGQLTSAYDLALFAREGLRRADFRRYVSTVSTAFPAEMPRREGQERTTYQIYNQNPLLLSGYRGVVGVKTGYTTLAGRTFVGAAERHGHLLVVTMLANVESTDVAAERLLDWGFAHLDTTPVGYLVGASVPESRVAAPGTYAAAPGSPTTAGPDLSLELGRAVAVTVVLLGLVALVAGGIALHRGYGRRGSASLPRA